MDYETIEIKQSETKIVSDDLEAKDALVPASSCYEYVEGAEDSPYIVTSSTY